MNKKITVLGSTGSIGTQTLEICRRHDIAVNSAAALNNTKILADQSREFHMKKVCICNKDKYNELKLLLNDTDTDIICGEEGLCELVSDDDAEFVVNSVVGMVGLLPTLTAIEHNKDIALANKETLVAGGHLVMPAAKARNVNIYPVDSEHSAIFQCLQGNKRSQLRSIILTASGGPFFGMTKDRLKDVSPEQALAHPNWNMGSKITIDSATMMNKGLELMEAGWLFDTSPDRIHIVVHRQSVVHSAVEYEDGAVIAQLGVPDMKIPIQYALLYPERTECPVKRLSLEDYGTLTFEKPDTETFDCLRVCIQAAEKGGDRPCIVNGVNEAAVAKYLNGKISFIEIGELAVRAFEEMPRFDVSSYEGVRAADRAAREFVEKEVCG